jgi:hypothetical protein
MSWHQSYLALDFYGAFSFTCLERLKDRIVIYDLLIMSTLISPQSGGFANFYFCKEIKGPQMILSDRSVCMIPHKALICLLSPHTSNRLVCGVVGRGKHVAWLFLMYY